MSPITSVTGSPASTPYCDPGSTGERALESAVVWDSTSSPPDGGGMDVLYARCAGLDVHSRTVVACARLTSGAEVRYEHVTVPTTTRGLLELADWLSVRGVTHVALEATGVYGKPVWHVLEDQFSVTLAHPQHGRNVPGRKSDTNDATWMADLLAMGLIRGSVVPRPRSRSCAI